MKFTRIQVFQVKQLGLPLKSKSTCDVNMRSKRELHDSIVKIFFSFFWLKSQCCHGALFCFSYSHNKLTLFFSDRPNCLTWKTCILVNFIHVNMVLGLTSYFFPFTPCWTCLASACVSYSLGLGFCFLFASLHAWTGSLPVWHFYLKIGPLCSMST